MFIWDSKFSKILRQSFRFLSPWDIYRELVVFNKKNKNIKKYVENLFQWHNRTNKFSRFLAIQCIKLNIVTCTD